MGNNTVVIFGNTTATSDFPVSLFQTMDHITLLCTLLLGALWGFPGAFRPAAHGTGG